MPVNVNGKKIDKPNLILKPGVIKKFVKSHEDCYGNRKKIVAWHRKRQKFILALCSLASSRLKEYFKKNPEVLSHILSAGECQGTRCYTKTARSLGYSSLVEMENDFLDLRRAWKEVVRIEIERRIKQNEVHSENYLIISSFAI